MSLRQARKILVRLTLGIVFCGAGSAGNWATAQAQTGPIDDLQRSVQQYRYQLSAPSGAKRGEEIYFFKCWICHNQYTVKAGTPAPLLKDLYERPRMRSGEPVNDETVAKKIRDGGPLMPAYGSTLNDQDIADLLSYIREGKCCFEGELLPANPWYRATAQSGMPFQYRNNLRGGPTGNVRESNGEALEGIMVQLIAQENSIRTTVYTNEEGRYEFPQLPTGQYTLRIARPREFQPYRRSSLRIDGAPALEQIVLEKVTEEELLPHTPGIAGQLSGAEWLMNVGGTQEEKRLFVKNCNWCHSYQLIFRNRYNEHSWRQVVDRMSHYSGSPLINRGASGRMTPEKEDLLVKWLARVSGPETKNAPLKMFNGPKGPATRVIVTEYELPRLWHSTHDVAGDSQGNLWYSPLRFAD